MQSLAPKAAAQATEGAVFLLVPVGARPIARGQAGASLRLGAEGVWWNPASIGWLAEREIAFDHTQLEFIQGDALDVVIPAGRAGVLGASGLYFQYGDQDATDSFGNVTGRLSPRASVVMATYAAPFGARIAAGVSFKFVRNSQSCSGQCPGHDLFSVSGNALDVGIQLVPDSARRLTIGAALRNFGIGRLQTIDAEQADPLPTRLHAGATYSLPVFSSAIPGSVLDLTSEVVVPPVDASSADFRLGAEIRFADRLSLRAGVPTIRWGGETNTSGDGSKAVMGIGYRQGKWSFDLARAFLGTSAEAGEPPTYVSFRVIF